MKEKLWIVLIVLGVIITIGSIIVDLILALNGILIPNSLGWVVSMVGVCIIALGVVFGIGSMTSKTL